MDPRTGGHGASHAFGEGAQPDAAQPQSTAELTVFVRARSRPSAPSIPPPRRSPASTPPCAAPRAHATARAQVQNLLNQMVRACVSAGLARRVSQRRLQSPVALRPPRAQQGRFQTMSDNVLARIDDMGARIDGAHRRPPPPPPRPTPRGVCRHGRARPALVAPTARPVPHAADLERSVGELIQQAGVDGTEERRK